MAFYAAFQQHAGMRMSFIPYFHQNHVSPIHRMCVLFSFFCHPVLMWLMLVLLSSLSYAFLQHISYLSLLTQCQVLGIHTHNKHSKPKIIHIRKNFCSHRHQLDHVNKRGKNLKLPLSYYGIRFCISIATHQFQYDLVLLLQLVACLGHTVRNRILCTDS